MKLLVNKQKLVNSPHTFMRRAGYGFIRDRRRGTESFVRRFTRNHYPRFHVYVSQRGENYEFNLHLDQKQPSYKGSHAHNAEYDGAMVASEIKRLENLVGDGMTWDEVSGEKKPAVKEAEEKKGFFARLFS